MTSSEPRNDFCYVRTGHGDLPLRDGPHEVEALFRAFELMKLCIVRYIRSRVIVMHQGRHAAECNDLWLRRM